MTAEQTLNAARLAELEAFQATLDADTPAKREEARRIHAETTVALEAAEAQAPDASLRSEVVMVIPRAVRLAELEAHQAVLDAETPAEREEARRIHSAATKALDAVEAVEAALASA